MKNIVHPGFQKCASTFLQQQIFPEITGYNFLVDNDWNKIWSSKHLGAGCGEKGSILSSEGFTTFLMSDISGNPVFPREKALHNIRRCMGPDTKILFVIRRQDSLLESYYRFKADFSQTTDMFIDYPLSWRFNFLWGSRSRRGEYIRTFDYCATILPFEAAFGWENIHILFYEDIIQDPDSFFTGLENLFEENLDHLKSRITTRENVSDRRGFSYSLPVRLLNKVSGGILGKFLPKKLKYVSESEKRKVLKLFAANNRYLLEYFEIEDRYGYGDG
jgi:hypothetical protein